MLGDPEYDGQLHHMRQLKRWSLDQRRQAKIRDMQRHVATEPDKQRRNRLQNHLRYLESRMAESNAVALASVGDENMESERESEAIRLPVGVQGVMRLLRKM